MGHFARECHSARVGTLFFREIMAEATEEEAGLLLKSQIVLRRARGDTEATAVTEAEADHPNQKKVVKC